MNDRGTSEQFTQFERMMFIPLCVGWIVGATPCLSGQDDRSHPQLIETSMPALVAYEYGFVRDVMRAADARGIQLNDMTLLENDAPGAGWSQKGPFLEPLHQGVLAAKTWSLIDTSALAAHIVLYLVPPSNPDRQKPYYLLVNGHRIEGKPVAWHEGTWHWVQVPVDWLQTGVNEIIVGCDAEKGRGYELLFARDDEYDTGGGRYSFLGNTSRVGADQIALGEKTPQRMLQPIEVGQYSAKSTDGGRTWSGGRLGGPPGVRGEYTIRLNFKRYQPHGWLRSPVVDLWASQEQGAELVEQGKLLELGLDVAGTSPAGTEIAWAVRFADTADIMARAWGEFQSLGTGPKATFPLDHGDMRFMQWQAVLASKDGVTTPVVRGVTIRRNFCAPIGCRARSP